MAMGFTNKAQQLANIQEEKWYHPTNLLTYKELVSEIWERKAFAFGNGTLLEHEDIFEDVDVRDLRFVFKDCRLQYEDIFMEVPPF